MLRIYLDTCCFNRPYDDQSQIRISLETQAKLYIQKLIVDKRIELVYSYMSRYENSQNPFKIRKDTIADFFKNASVYVSEENADIIQTKASAIMETGIKAKDAIHIACAIFGKADVFLSTDIRLLKYKTDEIKLLNPTSFLSGMEEFL